MVSELVESMLHSLDDALLPTANWVLKLIDVHDQLDDATGIKVTLDDISSFQNNVAESFVADLFEKQHLKPFCFTGCCVSFQCFQSTENA